MSATPRRTAAMLLLSFPMLASGLHGQSAGTVRIRRYATDTVLAQGALVGRTGEKLIIEAGGQRAAYALSSDVLVERYQTVRRTGIGAIAGAVAGLLAAATLVPADTTTCGLGDPFCKGVVNGTQIAGLMLGATMGAGVGALVGSLFKGKGWSGFDPTSVPEIGPSFGLTVSPGNVGLALRLRW